MLKATKAFSSFSVNNMAEAKQFYSGMLGIDVKAGEMDTMWLNIEGTRVMFYPKDNHEPATYTVLNFLVADVEQAVDELTQKGVKFEIYNQEMLKTNEK